MILISGLPLQISEMLGEYSTNSMEVQILQQMTQSTGSYQFDNIEQLKFELALRKEIVEAAKRLNRSGLRFATFHQSQSNAQYWDRTANGGFLLKSGVKASDAIQDIFANGRKYATECATAMVIVYYGALLVLWGEDIFNRLFPSIYLMNWHNLDALLYEVGMPKTVTDILLGDRCYFRNPQVNPKTPELQGENVIVLPNDLYYGHGIGITNAEQIIRILNANRIEGATQPAYFMENSAARPNFKRLMNASRIPVARAAVLRWKPFPEPITR